MEKSFEQIYLDKMQENVNKEIETKKNRLEQRKKEFLELVKLITSNLFYKVNEEGKYILVTKEVLAQDLANEKYGWNAGVDIKTRDSYSKGKYLEINVNGIRYKMAHMIVQNFEEEQERNLKQLEKARLEYVSKINMYRKGLDAIPNVEKMLVSASEQFLNKEEVVAIFEKYSNKEY